MEFDGPMVVTLAIPGPCQGKVPGRVFTEAFRDPSGQRVGIKYCCPSCAAKNEDGKKKCFKCGVGKPIGWLRIQPDIFTGKCICRKCNDEMKAVLEEQGGSLKYCANCNISAPNLKKCGRCKDIYYCSRECQVVNWTKHKPNCGKL